MDTCILFIFTTHSNKIYYTLKILSFNSNLLYNLDMHKLLYNFKFFNFILECEAVNAHEDDDKSLAFEKMNTTKWHMYFACGIRYRFGFRLEGPLSRTRRICLRWRSISFQRHQPEG